MNMGGPLAQTTTINGRQFDPNTSPVRNSQAMELKVPKEVHTLNDAILEAAKTTAKAGKGRRRIVYVISDGKEYGSKAKTKDVIRYLQTNKISVYGTLVGDSSLPMVGFLDKIHLPLTMRDNILPSYTNETGGNLDAEFRQRASKRASRRSLKRSVRNTRWATTRTSRSLMVSSVRSMCAFCGLTLPSSRRRVTTRLRAMRGRQIR